MIIGIDARPAERPASRNRGVGMYTRRLCEALFARNLQSGIPHRFILAGSEDAVVSEAGVCAQRLPAIRKPSRLQWVVDRWALPRFLRRNGIELFHASEFTSIPSAGGSRVVAHVHDMIPFVFWEQYRGRIPVDYRWALQQAKRRVHLADRIITDSFHSRRDIAELTGYPESRIHVVYFGPGGTVEPSRRAASSPSPPESTASLPAGLAGRPYFLYVGESDFRKNVPFLVRGFGAFSQKHSGIALALVGETFLNPRLPDVAAIYREMDHPGLRDRIWMPGFVPAASLRRLYAGAVALVFPSLYEGFGLPVLEAMTLGTAVAAARTSSIPEVLGETGIYFDPADVDSLVSAMETLYSGPSLRQDLIVRARERATQFSWEQAAAAVFQIYAERE